MRNWRRLACNVTSTKVSAILLQVNARARKVWPKGVVGSLKFDTDGFPHLPIIHLIITITISSNVISSQTAVVCSN